VEGTAHNLRKLPAWLRRPLPASGKYRQIEAELDALGVETICANTCCPNRGLCWSQGSAAVLILGNVCTRGCAFCALPTGKAEPPDPVEPDRIARLVERMGLKYLVITSVSRDDLPDGGASHFRDCIYAVRGRSPQVKFELLVPDFRHCQGRAIEILKPAMPFVFAHNIETVPALYPLVRPGGCYRRSLELLNRAKQGLAEVVTKSSIMLGLGETDEQVEQVLLELREVGCDRIVIGQYLKPPGGTLEVVDYVTPPKFDFWRQKAKSLGFSYVLSEPFARSSYMASA